ncbi:MAG: TIGR00270 family protein [Thermoprotei archaeon]|nr:MAG: TIGR00270 family protein [Thermoprotei archaeon]
MQCELCGRPIMGQPIKAWIEGAQLTVCPNCARYGSLVKQEKTRSPRHQTVVKQKSSKLGVEDLVLVENYNVLIRHARERMGMTQADLAKLIGEKESIIRRLESGRMTPSLELARKLEKTLKIKLFEEVKQLQELPRPQSFQLTLGDVAIIKERGKSSNL